MSVLIKGMKMPTDQRARIVLHPNGQLFVDHGTWFTEYEAIELPDHGDLIDRDKVVAWLADWSKQLIETYGENDEYVNCLSEVLERLGCDDVVIPAERSEG